MDNDGVGSAVQTQSSQQLQEHLITAYEFTAGQLGARTATSTNSLTLTVPRDVDNVADLSQCSAAAMRQCSTTMSTNHSPSPAKYSHVPDINNTQMSCIELSDSHRNTVKLKGNSEETQMDFDGPRCESDELLHKVANDIFNDKSYPSSINVDNVLNLANGMNAFKGATDSTNEPVIQTGRQDLLSNIPIKRKSPFNFKFSSNNGETAFNSVEPGNLNITSQISSNFSSQNDVHCSEILSKMVCDNLIDENTHQSICPNLSKTDLQPMDQSRNRNFSSLELDDEQHSPPNNAYHSVISFIDGIHEESNSLEEVTTIPNDPDIQRIKQRRKARKPLKSSIRYMSTSPVPASELSPPPTLTSPVPPPLPSTPPSVSAPLSPPLSDVQSSLSSLSPCSSVTGDETVKSAGGTRAPLPRLLPIGMALANGMNYNGANSIVTSASFMDSGNSNNVLKISKMNKFLSPDNLLLSSPISSSASVVSIIEGLSLPPPPPYPNYKKSNGYESDKSSTSTDECKSTGSPPSKGDSADSIGHSFYSSSVHTTCDEIPIEKRPPPPPYHSHFFNNKSTDNDNSISKITSDKSNLSNCVKKRNRPDDNLSDDSSCDHSFSSVNDVSSIRLSSIDRLLPSSLKQRPSDDPEENQNNYFPKAVNEEHLPGKFSINGLNHDLSEETVKGFDNSEKSATRSSLSSYSTATIAMLLQQLAAVQRTSQQVNSNTNEQLEPSMLVSSVDEPPSQSSEHENTNKADTLLDSNDGREDSDSARINETNNDSQIKGKTTINIDINGRNLSSILNSLISKTTLVKSDSKKAENCGEFSSEPSLKSLIRKESSNSNKNEQNILGDKTSTESDEHLNNNTASLNSLLKTTQLLSNISTSSLLSSGQPSMNLSEQEPSLIRGTSSPSLRPSSSNDCRISSFPSINNENETSGNGPSSPQSSLSNDTSQIDEHDRPSSQHSSNMSALIAAAALQNSYGLSSGVIDSPLSRLLMGSNSTTDFSSYAALCGADTSMIMNSYPGLSAALPGANFLGDLGKCENSEKTMETFIKNLGIVDANASAPGSLNSLNSMATLSYLLQQQQYQQLESVGLAGATAAGGLNSLATLSGLNSLAGLSNLPAGLGGTDASLHQVLKKLRYCDGANPVKRKPRSSNHTKSFHCSLCSKRFSLKDELEEHMLTHTSDELGNESYMQKSFACTECSFRTKYKFCLQRHMHIHSGEKPLVCPYCRYRSISKVSYDNHIRTHTGEKPFACPYCSYKSSFKNNLTKHVKTHTGSSKPYTCNKCSSCFTSQMQLKAHMRLHLDPAGSHNCSQCLYTCMSRFELECHMRTHIPV